MQSVARVALATAPHSLRHWAADVAEITLRGVAKSTLRKYAAGFEAYAAFCVDNGLQPLPASAPTVSAYLAARYMQRRNFGAVSCAVASIGFAHRACGLPPLPEGQWHLMVEAARKDFARAVVRKMPLTPTMVRQVIEHTLHDAASEQQAILGVAMALGFVAGARFSDLAAMRFEDFADSNGGLTISPSGRRKNDGTNKASEHRRNLFAARVGGDHCVVDRFLHFKKKFGWTRGPFLPFEYNAYLSRYRAVISKACGVGKAEVWRFATHSGRRGSGTRARSDGASPSAVRSFAGVKSLTWEDTYADSLIPEERRAVSRLLAETVGGKGTAVRRRHRRTPRG